MENVSFIQTGGSKKVVILVTIKYERIILATGKSELYFINTGEQVDVAKYRKLKSWWCGLVGHKLILMERVEPSGHCEPIGKFCVCCETSFYDSAFKNQLNIDRILER